MDKTFFGMTEWGLMCSVLFGAIGLGYFIYGKKTANLSALISGILLMGYTLLVSDTTLIILLGIVIMALPFISGKF